MWLPSDYDAANRYAVIYMHDGQMLFDSTTTWNKQEWGADDVAALLIRENKIKPCIIVGIWNRDDYRYTEYYPEKGLSFLSKRKMERLIRKGMKGEPLGDEYLRFVVKGGETVHRQHIFNPGRQGEYCHNGLEHGRAYITVRNLRIPGNIWRGRVSLHPPANGKCKYLQEI